MSSLLPTLRRSRSALLRRAIAVLPHVVAVLVIVPNISVDVARAQDIVPGGGGRSARDMASSYRTMVAATLDSIRFRWEVAANYGDVRALTGMYTSDAVFIAATGTLVRGSGSIEAVLGRWLSRAHNFHLTTDHFYASGDLIVLVSSVSYDADWATGGSFSVTDRVTFVLRRAAHDDWFIDAQSGGGLPLLTKAREMPELMAIGAEETLGVRVLDATGAPVAGSIVLFRNEMGGGTLDPPAVLTDPQGVARVVFRIGESPGRHVVRAVVAMAPDDPLFFATMAGSGVSVSPADSAPPSPGASPPW
ncbi:MAG TPA: nuclear transport factor 2 family protein [Gemmatimonadaceae bacterium]|nr:nuclear transport factor 2 family protein [Gemmatimonadaceae bacterium]